MVDIDGYYEYEERFGYSQFDLPRRKFLAAPEAWLGIRRGTLDKKLDLLGGGLLTEVFYSHQPPYLREGAERFGGPLLQKLDRLAEWMLEPDESFEKIAEAWENDEDLFILTNNTQNIYEDRFADPQSIG